MRVRKDFHSEIVIFLVQDISTLVFPGVRTVAAPGSRLLLAAGKAEGLHTKGASRDNTLGCVVPCRDGHWRRKRNAGITDDN